MAILTDTGFPPTFLNQYILSELKHYELIAAAEELSPMVPAQFPTNIEDLYNDSIQIRQTESPLLIVYDRLMRFRPTPFYLQKREQLIYFIWVRALWTYSSVRSIKPNGSSTVSNKHWRLV